MDLKTFLISLSLILFATCTTVSETESEPTPPGEVPTPRPNVVLITLDTLRADYLGCYGKTDIETPHLDGLAARGVRFENAVVQIPLTTPSHASILTGTYPQIHKIRDVGGFLLDEDIPTVASELRERGYETAAFVSAAVLHHYYGLDRGFGLYNDDMKSDPDREKLPGVVAEVRAEVISERGKNWLEGRDLKVPFFLWLHYYDPHFPYDPPEPFRTQYAVDPYAGEVAYLDEQIGKVLDYLEYSGLGETTLVLAISDHGESLGEHGEQTHGVFLYDATVRVPFLVYGPGILAGRSFTQQVRSIDVAPTILESAGIEPPPQIQGVSLLPLLKEGRPVRSNYSYMETLYPKTQMGWSELRGMRADRWKLVIAPRPELYDLHADPAEAVNAIGSFPLEADRLQKQVWEVDGPPGSLRKIEAQPLDEATRQQLQSLGYVSAGRSRDILTDLSGPDPKDRVEVLQALDEATDLMNEGHFAEAVPKLRMIIPTDPGNPLLYQQLGLCLQETLQLREALAVYEKAVEQKADTDRTYAEMGEVLIRLGQLQKGVDSLQRSANLNPRNLETFANLANACLQLGRLDEARSAIRAIQAQNPGHAAAHNLLGTILIQEGRPDRAVREFEAALTSNPDLVEPYMNLGLLAQMSGNRDKALRYFREFLLRAKDPQYQEIVPRVELAVRELERGG